jgi:hypothetical protein
VLAAREKVKGKKVRPKSMRVLVFFSDGHPTAFRGIVGGKGVKKGFGMTGY